MATTAITTTSKTKEWVLACTQFEQCEIESLNQDVSFIESELIPPTDPKETNSMYFLKNIPRDFSGDEISSLWVFIDNKNIIRKRPPSKATHIAGVGVIDESLKVNINPNALGYDAYFRNKNVTDYSVLHAMATFDISPKTWFVDEDDIELPIANTSTRATSKKGGFNVTSGGTNGNSCVVRGRRHPRYQPNRGWLFSSAGVLPDKDASGLREFGGITEESGLFFELDSGVLSAIVRQAEWQYFTSTSGQTDFIFTERDITSETNVVVRTKLADSVIWNPTTDFTVNATTETITFDVGRTLDEEVIILVIEDIKKDITQDVLDEGIDIEKEHLYDIQSQWRGAGNAFFYVDFKLIHTHVNTGVGVKPIISNPALPIYFRSENKGDEVSMLMGCADLTSEGGNIDKIEYTPIVNDPQYPIVTQSINADDRVLLVAHSPQFFKGRHNTRDVQALRVSSSANKNSFIKVYLSRNPIWANGSLLLKERIDGSAILYDNALNATDTGIRTPLLELDRSSASLISARRIKEDNSISIDNPSDTKIDFTLTHGDYFIVTGSYEKTGTSEMFSIIELGEEI